VDLEGLKELILNYIRLPEDPDTDFLASAGGGSGGVGGEGGDGGEGGNGNADGAEGNLDAGMNGAGATQSQGELGTGGGPPLLKYKKYGYGYGVKPYGVRPLYGKHRQNFNIEGLRPPSLPH
jgi:hypothetical protein